MGGWRQANARPRAGKQVAVTGSALLGQGNRPAGDVCLRVRCVQGQSLDHFAIPVARGEGHPRKKPGRILLKDLLDNG